MPANPKVLKISILGVPNSGKSTLVNQLLNRRISSVSSKINTTKNRLSGILTDKDVQLIILDTPGILPNRRIKKFHLERSFIIDPHSSLWESDLVLVVQDVADEFARQRIDREILKCLFTHPEKETILVLNKIDRVSNKKILLDLIAQLTGGRLNNQQFLDTTTRKSKPVGGKDSHLFDYDTLFARTAAKLNIQLPSSDNKPSLIDKNTKNSSSSSSSEHVLSLIDELKQCENFLKENLDRITVSSSSGEQDSQRLGDELSLAEKRRQRTQMPASEEHPAAATTTTTTTTTDMSLVSKIKEISAEEFKRDLMKTTDWHVYYKKLSSIGSLIADKTHWPYFNQVFMVSAQQNDGVEDLKRYLLSRARPGEWLFTRNMLTDQLPKDMAEMCVREKLLEHVSGEVPYQIGLETSFWEIDDHNVLNVIVSLIPGGKKANVKRHMDGAKLLKKVAEDSRRELMATFNCEVNLRLKVKI